MNEINEQYTNFKFLLDRPIVGIPFPFSLSEVILFPHHQITGLPPVSVNKDVVQILPDREGKPAPFNRLIYRIVQIASFLFGAAIRAISYIDPNIRQKYNLIIEKLQKNDPQPLDLESTQKHPLLEKVVLENVFSYFNAAEARKTSLTCKKFYLFATARTIELVAPPLLLNCLSPYELATRPVHWLKAHKYGKTELQSDEGGTPSHSISMIKSIGSPVARVINPLGYIAFAFEYEYKMNGSIGKAVVVLHETKDGTWKASQPRIKLAEVINGEVLSPEIQFIPLESDYFVNFLKGIECPLAFRSGIAADKKYGYINRNP